MAAELQLSLAKNISMIAEDLETMTPRELYERVLTGTENVLKETFRKMEKKQTKTENWCGYIQNVATRAARAALYEYQQGRKRQTMTALFNIITKIIILDGEERTISTQTGEEAAGTPTPPPQGNDEPWW